MAERLPPANDPNAELSETETLRRRLVRLAYDVHDGPMQCLIAAGYAASELQRTVAGSAPGYRQALDGQLDRMIAELTSAETGLRSLISRLEQGVPTIETIEEIVDAEVALFQTRSNTDVSVDTSPGFQPDSKSQAIAIKSVLREALRNVAKHSQASEVQIRVEASPAGILLEIEDNGIGFDPAAVRKDALGLVGMKDRVALLDGEIVIRTRSGGPTGVTALFERWHCTAAEPNDAQLGV
jgi:two-component system sensor histidine kinase DegS